MRRGPGPLIELQRASKPVKNTDKHCVLFTFSLSFTSEYLSIARVNENPADNRVHLE